MFILLAMKNTRQGRGVHLFDQYTNNENILFLYKWQALFTNQGIFMYLWYSHDRYVWNSESVQV